MAHPIPSPKDERVTSVVMMSSLEAAATTIRLESPPLCKAPLMRNLLLHAGRDHAAGRATARFSSKEVPDRRHKEVRRAIDVAIAASGRKAVTLVVWDCWLAPKQMPQQRSQCEVETFLPLGLSG